jgi:hypothetical protein
MSPAVARTEALTRSFGRLRAVDGLSMEVPSGRLGRAGGGDPPPHGRSPRAARLALTVPAGALLVADLVLLAAAARRFRRDRLLGD